MNRDVKMTRIAQIQVQANLHVGEGEDNIYLVDDAAK